MSNIIIQKPVRRTLIFEVRDVHGVTVEWKKINLPFPYVVFNITNYISKKPILSVGFCNEYPNDETDVFFPALPNIYCHYSPLFSKACIIGEHQDLISEFWQSSFTSYTFHWLGDNLAIRQFLNKIPDAFTSWNHYYNSVFESLVNWSKLDSYIWQKQQVKSLFVTNAANITREINLTGEMNCEQNIKFKKFIK